MAKPIAPSLNGKATAGLELSSTTRSSLGDDISTTRPTCSSGSLTTAATAAAATGGAAPSDVGTMLAPSGPKKRRRPKEISDGDSNRQSEAVAGTTASRSKNGGKEQNNGHSNVKPKRARHSALAAEAAKICAAVSAVDTGSSMVDTGSSIGTGNNGGGTSTSVGSHSGSSHTGTCTSDLSVGVATNASSATATTTSSGMSSDAASLMRFVQSGQQQQQPQMLPQRQPQPQPSATYVTTALNPALALLMANPAGLASTQQQVQHRAQQAQIAAALATLSGGLGAAASGTAVPTSIVSAASSPAAAAAIAGTSPNPSLGLSAITQHLPALLAPAVLQSSAAQQAAAQATLAAIVGSAQPVVQPQQRPQPLPLQQQHQPIQPKPQQNQTVQVALKPLAPVPVAPAPPPAAASAATAVPIVAASLPSLQDALAAQHAHEVAAKALKQVEKKRGSSNATKTAAGTQFKSGKSRKKRAATTATSSGRKRSADATTASSTAVVPKRVQREHLVPSTVAAGSVSAAGGVIAAAAPSSSGAGHIHHHVRTCHPHQSRTMAPATARAAGEAAAVATPLLIPYMRKWKLEELEAHVKLLTDANQPIPHSVELLVTEARRKEEKRKNKRAANRRSASTSRARKKLLVEEMTRMNAMLRRQALILSLLPDMVLAINVDGVVTFCSAQVERILQHNSDDLIGAELAEILLPPTRAVLRQLVDKLVASGAEAANGADACADEGEAAANAEKEGNDLEDGAIGTRPDRREQENGGGENGSGIVFVSEQSEQCFPLSVVNVKNRTKHAAANVEDVSDSSGGENVGNASVSAAAAPTKEKGDSNDSKGGSTSSLTNNSSLSRSTTNSSFNNDTKDAKDAAPGDGEDGARSERESVSTDCAVKSVHRHGSSSGRKESSTRNRKHVQGAATTSSQQQQQERRQQQASSGDDSSSSSNLRTASEALNRNVRWHNEKMMTSGKGGAPLSLGLTDDVTGASVTANNAGARLSSLQHLPSMNAEVSNNDAGVGNNAAPPVEEGDGTKKVTKSKTSPVDRTTSNLTFGSLEDAQSSSSDSLLSGVEGKGGRTKRGSSGSAPRGRNGELSSEDSGYRESGESVPSREDTSSSASDDASTNEKDASRPKPLAPTCNVCVIRKDLSTVWCEVTSSIRTRTLDDDGDGPEGTVSAGTKMSGSESTSGDNQEKAPSEVHELLLCFRPIRDGEEKVGEELRFVPKKKVEADEEEQEQASADRSNTGSRSTEGVSSLTQSADRSKSTEDATNTSGSFSKADGSTQGPPKRPLLQEGITVSAGSHSSAAAASALATVTDTSGGNSGGNGSLEEPAQKKRRSLSPEEATAQSEADVAESLVLMNRFPQ
eukprot:CAMPEP_0178523822 /NCGR_PEP_ID=MMETSP0696-20121128/29310_1 /TAXON_ID=265572 /ORGANISM="Extubocellulus spinifer, Strain CCMP396" /LENGTH=1354 /DNA_ID=CAMNT_0020155107 /DNA_START=53 /DNA_END=4117 /DNA_ORIENTATION=-